MLKWIQEPPPSAMSITLVSNTKVFTARATGQMQTMRQPGTRWEYSMSYNNLSDEESRQFEALMAQLDGQAGRVMCYDFGRPDTPIAGSPVVDGTGQRGSSVKTKGWTPSTKVLLVGDYIMIGSEMKIVVEDVVADATGGATVKFEPPIRYSPKDAAPVSGECWAKFISKESSFTVDRHPGMLNSFSVTLVEDVRL